MTCISSAYKQKGYWLKRESFLVGIFSKIRMFTLLCCSVNHQFPVNNRPCCYFKYLSLGEEYVKLLSKKDRENQLLSDKNKICCTKILALLDKNKICLTKISALSDMNKICLTKISALQLTKEGLRKISIHSKYFVMVAHIFSQK